ncbi:hypothetical protein GUJ93_ZPchr0010g10256 [Zizania palustris]|uniref:Uncharacterized protein n=1 Tax=Zizania palustris TaxID=103762 RepID=A0A8J5W937_ZIZPA|nr:hypothetical protein GUJ93_ZPchr0010g10256 [Zizania palustris]
MSRRKLTAPARGKRRRRRRAEAEAEAARRRRRWRAEAEAEAAVEERYTRPQGLYPHPDIDLKKLRRLIFEAKLAPCYPGSDDPRSELDECPICFLFYPSLNWSKCCAKGICTECFSR